MSITPITEITEEHYNEMLGVLPPENWHKMSGGSFFQLCEHYDYETTSYFAVFNGKYYTFRNKTWLSVNEVTQLFTAHTARLANAAFRIDGYYNPPKSSDKVAEQFEKAKTELLYNLEQDITAAKGMDLEQFLKNRK